MANRDDPVLFPRPGFWMFNTDTAAAICPMSPLGRAVRFAPLVAFLRKVDRMQTNNNRHPFVGASDDGAKTVASDKVVVVKCELGRDCH
jgi:hypothetical protein